LPFALPPKGGTTNFSFPPKGGTPNVEAKFGVPPLGGKARALTILELLIAITIISILAAMALPSLLTFQTRAKVAVSRNNQRVLVNAIETYRMDYGEYPRPAPSIGDPFGIVARPALRALTTPVAYVGRDAFYDPFGTLRVQMPTTGMRDFSEEDPFRPPTPGLLVDRSSLYFHYAYLAETFAKAFASADGFAVASVGPDLKDSFIVYYPFPDSLPPNAARYGIHAVADSVYDPTNGTVSAGDLAGFGGNLAVKRFVGGGE
jgi:prepilin-type N-terminal cleavage/methylation domain-containing protein